MNISRLEHLYWGEKLNRGCALFGKNCFIIARSFCKAPANSTPRGLLQKRFFYLLTFKYLYNNDYCGCDNIHGGITS